MYTKIIISLFLCQENFIQLREKNWTDYTQVFSLFNKSAKNNPGKG